MPGRGQAGPAASARKVALVLQGGGALGAYQAGAYEALASREEPIDWIAGISIGAINAALIAGNPPGRRCERLREFWQRVTVAFPGPASVPAPPPPLRQWWDAFFAGVGMWQGVPGFFLPRPPWEWWPQWPTSVCDTAPLRQTLLDLVDFDLLNAGAIRFAVGAVDVETGNFTYFDNHALTIGPEHIMASGALPPGFPPVQIGERWYWDGGLVSNTPLTWVMRRLEECPGDAADVFQVDLFSARGALPGTLGEVAEREKDIRYSSRTRLVSDLVRERHELHRRLLDLAHDLPPDHRLLTTLLEGSNSATVNLVHVIHRRKPYETQNKDYEFSRLSMLEHWQAGVEDMHASLQLLARQEPLAPGCFRVLDQLEGSTQPDVDGRAAPRYSTAHKEPR